MDDKDMKKANYSANDFKESMEEQLQKDKFKDEFSQKLDCKLRPLLICMSIFGLYFPYHGKEKISKKCKILRIYCTVMIGLLVAGTVTYTYINRVEITQFGSEFAYHFLTYLYEALNIICACVMYASCSRGKGLDSIISQWGHLHRSKICMASCSFNRIVVTLLFISLVYFLSDIVLMCTVAVSKYNSTNSHFAKDLAVLIWRVAVELLHAGAWLLPMTLVSIISLGLTIEFCSFNREFKSAIQSDGQFEGNFEEYRRCHQNICNLVGLFDDNFNILFGCELMFNVAQILLKLYVILRRPELNLDSTTHAMMVVWLIFSVSFMTITCLCGGLINQKAHASLTNIYDCDLVKNKDISLENMVFGWSSPLKGMGSSTPLKIQVFLVRLAGDKIGLTAMNLFIIDKTVILTVVGVLASYYVILEQFQPALTSVNVDSVNITSSLSNQ